MLPGPGRCAGQVCGNALIMSNFPNGRFTIVNQETGRCMRVRLGESVDLGDYKEGTKYLLSWTNPPSLELGPADGTLATAWYYRQQNDSLERRAFNQIASSAVDDLQNIGEYCVWMYHDAWAAESEDTFLREWFAALLNDATGKAAERLDALIPEEWNAQVAQDYEAELADWKEEGEEFEGTVEELNGRQARLLERLRPEHGKLLEAIPGHMDAIVEALKKTRPARTTHGDGTPMNREELQAYYEKRLVAGAWAVQKLEREMERAEPEELESLLEEQLFQMKYSGVAEMADDLEEIGLSGLFLGCFRAAHATPPVVRPGVCWVPGLLGVRGRGVAGAGCGREPWATARSRMPSWSLAAAASRVQRVCSTVSTPVSCSRTRASRSEWNGRGCDLKAPGTATARGRMRELIRSARRAAWTRVARAPAARRARSYGDAAPFRVQGRSPAWFWVSRGYRARRSAVIIRQLAARV